MITFILILVFSLVLSLDVLAYRRVISHWHSRMARVITSAWFVITDLLPMIPFVALKIGIGDNPQSVMTVLMWIDTIYFFAILPRIALLACVLFIKNRTVGRIAGWTLCTVVAAILTVSLAYTRTNIVVKRVQIAYASLPAAFDGYRIAFFSDLHIGSMIEPRRECEAVVRRINELHPDMVIFGGDIVNVRHSELSPEILTVLGGLNAPDGVVAVLGNHDSGIYIKDSLALPREENVRRLGDAMREMNWNLLRDSTIYVTRGEEAVTITGIDMTEELLEYRHSSHTPSEWEAQRTFGELPDTLFNIAITHLPHLWHKITDVNHGNLTLAGHVHATQIKAEFGGISISPAMLIYKEWSGLYGEGEHRLYINDGVGNVGFYMRIGARPEITLIELNKM